MAVDTRDKRASAVMHTLPWRQLLPLPDGTVAQADRQQTAHHYSGIAAEAAAAIAAGIEVTATVSKHNTSADVHKHHVTAEVSRDDVSSSRQE